MAIPVEQLHQAVKLQANTSSNTYLKNIGTIQIDYYLNEAKDEVMTFLAPLVDRRTEVRGYLRQVTKRDVKLDFEKTGNGYVVAAFPEDYHATVRERATAKVGGCESRVLRVRKPSADKLNEMLRSPDFKPSFAYEETVAIEADDGLHVYYDGFDIQEVSLDYIRRVKDVAAPKLIGCKEYELATGKQLSQNIDFEIDSPYLFRRLPRIAVLMLLRDKNQVQDYQTQFQLIMGLGLLNSVKS